MRALAGRRLRNPLGVGARSLPQSAYGCGIARLLATALLVTAGMLTACGGTYVSTTQTMVTTVPIVAYRDCGNLPDRLAYEIETKSLSCTTARTIVREWGSGPALDGPGGSGPVRDLYCRYRSTGYESGKIRCKGVGKVVRWETGS